MEFDTMTVTTNLLFENTNRASNIGFEADIISMLEFDLELYENTAMMLRDSYCLDMLIEAASSTTAETDKDKEEDDVTLNPKPGAFKKAIQTIAWLIRAFIRFLRSYLSIFGDLVRYITSGKRKKLEAKCDSLEKKNISSKTAAAEDKAIEIVVYSYPDNFPSSAFLDESIANAKLVCKLVSEGKYDELDRLYNTADPVQLTTKGLNELFKELGGKDRNHMGDFSSEYVQAPKVGYNARNNNNINQSSYIRDSIEKIFARKIIVANPYDYYASNPYKNRVKVNEADMGRKLKDAISKVNSTVGQLEVVYSKIGGSAFTRLNDVDLDHKVTKNASKQAVAGAMNTCKLLLKEYLEISKKWLDHQQKDYLQEIRLLSKGEPVDVNVSDADVVDDEDIDTNNVIYADWHDSEGNSSKGKTENSLFAITKFLDVLNEAEFTHGKDIKLTDDQIDAILDVLADNNVAIGASKKQKDATINSIKALKGTYKNMAMPENDKITNEMKRNLASYDAALEKTILESKNIVEEYNRMLDMKVDQYKARGEIDTVIKRGSINAQMYQLMTGLKDKGYSEEEIRKIVVDTYMGGYKQDPSEIKDILNLRLAYNNHMISLFQQMIMNNYKILNISQEIAQGTADLFAASDKYPGAKGLAWNNVRTIIADNKEAFRAPFGYDFRKIGGGCALLSKYALGAAEEFITPENFIQYVMEYDIFLFSHGATVKKGDEKDYNQFNIDTDKKDRQTKNLITRASSMRDRKNYKGNKFVDSAKTIKDVVGITKYQTKYGKDPYRFANGDVPDDPNRTWMMQDLTTPGGVTYNEMNALVKGLIKEGYKSIFILSCNPGHHKLENDPEIAKADVKIKYIDSNVALSENDLEEMDNDIYMMEANIMDFCNANGLDYNNDEYFDECYEWCENNVDILYEKNILSNIWAGIVKYSSYVVGALVAAFKRILKFFTDIREKIRQKIANMRKKGINKTPEPIKVSMIVTESAKIVTNTFNDLESLTRTIMGSCDGIMKEINALQQKQLQITQQTKNYAQKMESNQAGKTGYATENAEIIYSLIESLKEV